MGILRVLLAIFVVGAHIRPQDPGVSAWISGGAIFAVKTFFIISGFYMALVLEGNYRRRPVRDFYASRALRILPVYWFVSIIALIAEHFLVPTGQFLHPLASPFAYTMGIQFRTLPWPILIYICVSLLTLLGMDTGEWLGFNRFTGQLSVAPNFGPNATSVVALCPAPQAWTIGIEFAFYLIAPFVVRRKLSFILFLAALSLGFRLYMNMTGHAAEPWSRTLFPSELIYFLGGVLSFRIYKRIPSMNLPTIAVRAIGAAVIVLVLVYGPAYNKYGDSLSMETVPYLAIVGGLPFLFAATRDFKLDNMIGELSYPIYMVHLLTMGMILWMPKALVAPLGAGWRWVIVNLAAVLISAVLLDWLVARPIDRFRTRFGARKGGQAAAETASADTAPAEPEPAIGAEGFPGAAWAQGLMRRLAPEAKPVEAEASAAHEGAARDDLTGAIELEVNGVVVRVGRGAEASTVAAVIKALKAAR